MKSREKVKGLPFFDRFMSLMFTVGSLTAMLPPSVALTQTSWQGLRSTTINISHALLLGTGLHDPSDSMPLCSNYCTEETFCIFLKYFYSHMNDTDHTEKGVICINFALHIVQTEGCQR